MIDHDKAILLADEAAAALRKFGNHAKISAPTIEIVRALVALRAYIAAAEQETRAALAKANRRYAALNARYQKLCKATGRKAECPENDGEDVTNPS